MKKIILLMLMLPSMALAEKHDHKKHDHKAHDHKNHDHKGEKVPSLETAPVTSPTKAVVTVNGMVCAFCAQGLEKSFKAQKEVEQIHVDLENKKVVVGYKKGESLTDEKIKNIIKEAGFDVVAISKE